MMGHTSEGLTLELVTHFFITTSIRGRPFLCTVFLICTTCKFGLTHPPLNLHKCEKKIRTPGVRE